MHVLVTGGAGFIGSNFVRLLLSETEHRVTTLDALTYAGCKQNLGETLKDPRHTFVKGDIQNKSLVEKLIQDVDAIVNFAAESHVDRSVDGAEPFVSTNIEGTRVLLDAALESDINRFLQISTDEVYGQIHDGEFSEEDPLNPRNPYAATKASADLLAHSYYTTHNLPVLVTRSSNNFGPRQHQEKLIPKFITRAQNGKSLPVYGDGSNIREWIYVEDNCRAVLTVLENGNPGEIYNIGSGIERSNLEVTEAILKTVSADNSLIEFVEDRPGHDFRYALDTTKIKSLGWMPKSSFEEGLKQTVAFYV